MASMSKDKTSIKWFDRKIFDAITVWWPTKCTRCNRHVSIDTSHTLDKNKAKQLNLPPYITINLCRECRKELLIRRIHDLKQPKHGIIPYKPTFDKK